MSPSLSAQEVSLRDKIEEKAIIGLPGVTNEQLNLISIEFAKYPQITSAEFIFGNHNCLLVTFGNFKNFSVYEEMLKTLYGIYPIENCYLKHKNYFNEIQSSVKAGTSLNIK
jgi:hypothetical protein